MSDEKPYEVGYKKPPAEHRFKAGKSGNPRGRPKGAKSKAKIVKQADLQRMILEEAYREVEVPTSNGTEKMAVAQLGIRALCAKAAKGDVRAQKLLLEHLPAAERDREQLRAEVVEAMREYAEIEKRRIAEAKRAGRRYDPSGPHPDDLEFDPLTGDVSVRGPATRKCRKLLKEARKEVARLRRLFEQLRQIAQNSYSEKIKAELNYWADIGEGHYVQRMDEMAPLARAWPRHWPPKSEVEGHNAAIARIGDTPDYAQDYVIELKERSA